MDQTPIHLGEHQVLRVTASSPTALEIESTWQPGSPPRTHWHPHQTEDFLVLEGKLTVELGGVRSVLSEGDGLRVSPRSVHRMWNAGPGVARARWTISPPQQTERMFRRIDRGLGPLSSLWFLWQFRREYRVGQPR